MNAALTGPRELLTLLQVQHAIHDYAGLKLTPGQVVRIASEPRIRNLLTLGGVDTCTREGILDLLAQEVLGVSWPTYGDPASEGEGFHERFLEAAEKAGYALA